MAGLGAAPAGSLDALARAKGLRFGSAVGAGAPLRDAKYRALLTAECGLLVAENEHKWYVLRPSADRFDFGPADRIAAFARESGLGLRGHTLLWNRDEFTPAWLKVHDFGSRPASAAEKMLVEHIKAVCARYPQIDSWDVVNETIDPATGALRDTVFVRAMGERCIDVAFYAAREAAPTARLVYNDYMSWLPRDARHRNGVLKLLEGMKARGVPVQALGVQGHIGAANDREPEPFAEHDPKAWRAFLDVATGLGLDLLITELDVHDKGLPADRAVRDRAVADHARAYLDLMLSYPQLKQVLCWGLCDRYSWLQGTSPRADKASKRPTPFDADYRPKPLREAIAAAFRAAPERTPWA